jgi:molecular chaperone GrpE (heat shock protein)
MAHNNNNNNNNNNNDTAEEFEQIMDRVDRQQAVVSQQARKLQEELNEFRADAGQKMKQLIAKQHAWEDEFLAFLDLLDELKRFKDQHEQQEQQQA